MANTLQASTILDLSARTSAARGHVCLLGRLLPIRSGILVAIAEAIWIVTSRHFGQNADR